MTLGTVIAVLNATPKILEASVKIYDRVRGRPPRIPRNQGEPDGPSVLRTDVTELEERVASLESTDEEQAALLTRVTQHNAALVRWLLILTLASALFGGIAIAGLVVAIVR